MKRPLRTIASLLTGISLGMLFAPKKGSDLRKKLAKSDDKVGDFGKELLGAAQDASGEVQKFLKSKEVQELIESGKVQFQDLVDLAKEKGDELSTKAKKELEALSAQAEKKANTLKKTVKRKATKAKKKVTRKVQSKVSSKK